MKCILLSVKDISTGKDKTESDVLNRLNRKGFLHTLAKGCSFHFIYCFSDAQDSGKSGFISSVIKDYEIDEETVTVWTLNSIYVFKKI